MKKGSGKPLRPRHVQIWALKLNRLMTKWPGLANEGSLCLQYACIFSVCTFFTGDGLSDVANNHNAISYSPGTDVYTHMPILRPHTVKYVGNMFKFQEWRI